MKTALITGATSGIGLEMAIYLHKLGWRLILTGRNEEILERMAKRFGSGTRYVALDLAERGAPEALCEFCRGTRVDFLINNAGFGVYGPMTETPLERDLALIDVNIRALHIIMKHFLKQMDARDAGHILNVGSIAGFSTGPLLSSYYASKNYVVRLTTAVREELRQKGSRVRVSVLCPGPVDTNFNRRAGVSFSAPPADARAVARYAIDRALDGAGIIAPSPMIWLGIAALHVCPETLAARVIYHVQKRKKTVK